MPTISFYHDQKEYFLAPAEILFFEAAGDRTYAHSRERIYRVKQRLYVLEAILPPQFIRVSKSALVNVEEIRTFATVVGTTGQVEFVESHKRLHISRAFIKNLRGALRQKAERSYHAKTIE